MSTVSRKIQDLAGRLFALMASRNHRLSLSDPYMAGNWRVGFKYRRIIRVFYLEPEADFGLLELEARN